MKLLLLLFVSILSLSTSALEIENCSEFGITFNNILEMRTYSNGSVKLFDIDTIEPAGAPAGVAVAINRGGDLSEMEMFCRYVWGLSSVNLKAAKSSFDSKKNRLKVVIPVSVSDGEGGSIAKILTLLISKGAPTEEGLVSATLK